MRGGRCPGDRVNGNPQWQRQGLPALATTQLSRPSRHLQLQGRVSAVERQLGSETLCEASRVGHRGVMGLQCTVAVAICVGLRYLGHYLGVFCWDTTALSIECLALRPTGSNYCCCACIQNPCLVRVVSHHLCFPFCTQPLISLCCSSTPPAFWASGMQAVPVSMPGCSCQRSQPV